MLFAHACIIEYALYVVIPLEIFFEHDLQHKVEFSIARAFWCEGRQILSIVCS